MPFIEGVGDEVLVLLSVWLLCSISLTASILWYRHRGGNGMPAEHISATMREEIIREIYPNGSRPSPVGDSVTCPICLDTFGVHTVTTNCGHLFDLDCYLSFWEHSGRQTNTQCPCCRQRVSLLFPNFEPSNNREISERIRRYNRLHGGVPRSAMEHITDVPELLRRIFMQLFSGRDGLKISP
jgi:RING finger protein 170